MDKRVSVVIPNLEEIKKMIKQENMSNGRLQSLQLPKQLNLGGTKPKKVYTPNLNAVRNKDKPNQATNKPGQKQKPASNKRSKDKLPDRENNKRPKYVQSEGIFSQGVGEVKTPSHVEKAPTLKEYNHSLAVPKFNRNNFAAKNKESSEISTIIDNYDASDSESENEYDPIVLPLDSNKESYYKSYKVKQEPAVIPKVENGCSEDAPINSNQLFDVKKVKVKLEKYDTIANTVPSAFVDDSKEYDEDNPAFSLLQVPNSFFGKVWSDDPKQTNLDYSLKHFPEGEIGKICIRKSGKMEFVINNVSFDLNVKDADGMAEMAVQFPGKESIALEPSLVTLGNVTEKLVLTPEWNTLFNRAKHNTKFYW